MAKKAILTGLGILLALIFATFQHGLAIDKVKIGAGVRAFYPYNLPYQAAEEKGLWKENSLEAELVLFIAATPLLQAMAAKHIDVGMNSVPSIIEAAVAGAPLLIVAHMVTRGAGFHLWVKADSPIKEGKDLKGSKVGVTVLGATSHAYARMVAKALGLEKEMKFVGAGGPAPAVAALKAGGVDGIMLTVAALANLMAAGEVRKVLSAADYHPRRWVEHVIVVRKDFVDSKPTAVRKTVRVLTEGSRFLKENPQWALEKLQGKEFFLSAKAAQIVYDNLIANIEYGKIDREGLENVRNFLVEYGIVAKEKAPPIDAVYRDIFD